MNSSINKFNPFQTVAGYNQVDELKNFIVADTCIITMKDMSHALINMKSYVNKIGLWHSIVHDKDIDENFIADLKIRIDNKYKNFNQD